MRARPACRLHLGSGSSGTASSPFVLVQEITRRPLGISRPEDGELFLRSREELDIRNRVGAQHLRAVAQFRIVDLGELGQADEIPTGLLAGILVVLERRVSTEL